MIDIPLWVWKAALVIGGLIAVDIALLLAVRRERVRQVHRARRGLPMAEPYGDWARRPRS